MRTGSCKPPNASSSSLRPLPSPPRWDFNTSATHKPRQTPINRTFSRRSNLHHANRILACRPLSRSETSAQETIRQPATTRRLNSPSNCSPIAACLDNYPQTEKNLDIPRPVCVHPLVAARPPLGCLRPLDPNVLLRCWRCSRAALRPQATTLATLVLPNRSGTRTLLSLLDGGIHRW